MSDEMFVLLAATLIPTGFVLYLWGMARLKRFRADIDLYAEVVEDLARKTRSEVERNELIVAKIVMLRAKGGELSWAEWREMARGRPM